MDRRAYLGVAVGTSAALAGCVTLGSVLSGQSHDVGMTRHDFVPETHTVSVGETVTWKNTSGAAHTVTAYGGTLPDGASYFATGGFESEPAARAAWENGAGGIDPRETFTHTFTVPGEIGYVCLPHEPRGMTGRIVVEG